jgi:hypothetical protein
LLPADTNVTLDLDGCFLDIPTPAPGAAAIAVPQGSALTIEDTSTDQTGSLTADGGDTDSNLIGAGAGIGSDGGAGDSGAITILGGAVEAQGGNVRDSNGPLSAGAGAAIGGGGGGTLAGSVGQAGGSAGAVTIDGGSVTANGGSNNSGAGAAAVGGGGGGGVTNAGGSPGAGGAGADVVISAGSVTTDPAGLAPLPTDVGIGPGSAGSDASAGTTGAAGGPGSVTVEGGASGAAPVALGGEIASVLTVDSGVTLDAILETGLTLDATGNVNNGTIDLASQIEGAGTLDNAGSINVSELDGADAGDAVGPGLTVTGNVYDVTYNNDAAMSPNAVTVYAPTFKAGGEQLPMIDGKEGYDASGWESAGQAAFTVTTPLAPLASDGAVPLSIHYSPKPPTIKYTLSSAKSETRYGWYGQAVTVKFSCQPPEGSELSGSCPAAQTIAKSGRDLTATGTVKATNGSSASVTTAGIDIDTAAATVRVTGPASGKSYKNKAPSASCSASESLSGVASCTLSTSKSKIKGGYHETVTAKATTKAGVVSTKSITFTVKS